MTCVVHGVKVFCKGQSRRGLVKRICLILLSTVTITVTFPRIHAAGATSHVSSAWTFPADVQDHTVGSPGLAFTAALGPGESRYFFGRLQARGPSSVKYNIGISAGIDCSLAGRTFSGMWSARNWEGYDAQPAGLAQRVRFLLTATAPGVYTCRMRVRAYSNGGSPTMTVLPGPTVTFLTMTDTHQAGAMLWSEPQATYLGNKTGQSSSALLLSRSFSAQLPGESKSIAVDGDLQLTTCTYATASCPPEHYGMPGVKSGTVKSRLVVTRQGVPGLVCDQPPVADPPGGHRQVSISNDAHHMKVHHSTSIVNSPKAGCANVFDIRVELYWISGNPVKVDPPASSSLMTLAIARNVT